MEDADKVSSSAPDDASRDLAVNEAAVAGQTPTDETLRSEEEMSEKTSTEGTSAPKTAEETRDPVTTEGTSALQTNEVTSSLQTTEDTSTQQITEVTSAVETSVVTSSLQTTEDISTQQITEVTSAAETSVVTSSLQITEDTSTQQITEVTSAAETSVVTSSLQTTEDTSTQQITDVTSAAETSVVTSLQTTEDTSTQQITEITTAGKTTEETSTPKTAEKTRDLETTEVASSSHITEEASTQQNNELTSVPQINEETSAPLITKVTSSPEPAAVRVHVPPETEVTSSSRDECRGAVTTEAAAAASSSSSSPPPQQADASASEERATPVVYDADQASEVRVTPALEEESSSADVASEDRQQEKEPHALRPTPSHEPDPSVGPAVTPAQLPSDRWDPASVSTKLTMDLFGHKDSAAFSPDVLNQSDDDFMFEMKKSPLRAFSPRNESLEETAAARRHVELSESPSPDLVQDAYDGDEGLAQSEEVKQDSGADAAVSLSYASSDLFSDANVSSDDRPMSLPDILKSSPLNPDKVDSGSSEGSPDFSPVHRSENDSPNSSFSTSANSPFDSKILLLKEMVEETEAKAAEKAKELENGSEQSFVAFDLLKETDVPAKSDSLLKDKEVEVQTAQTADKFECLNFPTSKAEEHWDSESPSADSFSPVLDAVTQKPSSFTAEREILSVREEAEGPDELSEQEVSSEEFEFVERPPRGAVDEFIEMQDGLTFMKPSEMLLDEDRSVQAEPQGAADPVSSVYSTSEKAQTQSSYHLLSQTSDKSSAVRGKAGLESDFQEIPPAPVIHPSVDKTGAERKEAEVSDLSAAAVLDLLYWRDVRASVLVFGSSLLILLSLISCSIISVLSYTTLALLSVTISFRIYRGVLQAVQKSDEGHPFRRHLERDVVLSSDAVQRHSDVVVGCVNGVLKELRRLFLVEDLVDSLKFAVFLWIFTHVGAWLNGLTLLILGLVGAFSTPIIYERHQSQIDQFISLVKTQIKDVFGKIQAKVPGAKKSE